MSHVNRFLQEVDRQRRSDRVDHIYEARVAQLDDDGYKKEMQRLRQAERIIEAQRSPDRQRRGRTFMTPDEQRKWDTETTHLRFAEMSPDEQERIASQRTAGWSQIPAHLQQKAKKLAGH